MTCGWQSASSVAFTSPAIDTDCQRHKTSRPNRTTHQSIMDSASVSPETMQQLQNMSPQEKQQLNQFIQGENQKAQIQGVVHSLTDTYALAR